MFKQKYRLQDAAAEGGDNGSANTESVQKGPNDSWQDDARLDQNGNPLDDASVKKALDNKKVEDDKQKASDDNKQNKSDDSGDKKEEVKKVDNVNLSAPVVKQVEKLVIDAGLDSKEVAKVITDNGGVVTPDMVKALSTKHGDAVAAVIVSQLEGFYKANKSVAAKQDQAIFDQVQDSFKGITEQSGQDSWKELSAWAKENVDAKDRKEINKVLKQGGLAAKYAVDDLVSRFKKHQPETQDAVLITGDNTDTSGGFKPLSKREYTSELRALEEKGHVYGQSQEMSRLDERRRKSIQRGI